MKQSPAELFPFQPGLGKQELMGASMGMSISSSMSSPLLLTHRSMEIPTDSHTQIHANLRDNHSRAGRRERLFLQKTSLRGAEMDFGRFGCSGCSALDPRATLRDKPVVP